MNHKLTGPLTCKKLISGALLTQTDLSRYFCINPPFHRGLDVSSTCSSVDFFDILKSRFLTTSDHRRQRSGLALIRIPHTPLVPLVVVQLILWKY